MKIVETVVLLQRGKFSESAEWRAIRDSIHAFAQAEWPIGSGSFTICLESGKKSGKGNAGSFPSRLSLCRYFKAAGWTLEYPW
ncbi:hypothetical protein [Ferrovum sp.]|jgi:hypothetical protein|uniref:hypothetical protein n=1 Tax=Ferrovum sp. TaxID=2609467 RepID=UPI0026204A9C|nr:hypothetical protein [Ferrovum sp.]